jgi:nucleoside-diphosphate-sugar epimerase
MSLRQKFLITGTSSGLGKYLLEELESVPFRRSDIAYELKAHKGTFYDCIVHCATDARNTIKSDELWMFYQSHIELTERLIEIPHRLFVFISSAAVYPDPFRLNAESDVIDLPDTRSLSPTHGLYGFFKLLAEAVTINKAEMPLILRVTGIIGRTSRLNNLCKVLISHPGPVTLSPHSSYNLVSMSQIKRFIEVALAGGITGIFNLGATDNVSLQAIADAVNSRPTFGNYVHNVERIDTTKVRRVCADFDKGSIQIAREVVQELKGHR